MTLAERIQRYIDRLPATFQVEVLRFVEYLMAKAEREAIRQEERDWPNLSLASAMRGMEGEDTPAYTLSDLRIEFS